MANPIKKNASLATPEPKPVKQLPLKVNDKGMAFDPDGPYMSPRCTVQWVALRDGKPDEYQGKQQYKATAVFAPQDPDFLKMADRLTRFENRWRQHNNQPPVEMAGCIKTDAAKFNGWPYIQFTRNPREDGSMPISLYDVTGKAAPSADIRYGDRVKLSFTACGYFAKNKAIGCGIKPYLQAVQLLESVGGDFRNPFSDESSGSTNPSVEDTSTSSSGSEDDDIPF
jgi:hypothetical protein